MLTNKIPKLTDLELTNNCNLACPICTENNREKGEIDLLELEKIIIFNIEILKGSTLWLHFRGEPLLYSNLINAIDLLHSYGVKSSFSTNGILLSEKNIDNILNSKLSRIIISAITDNKKEYIELRGKDTLAIVEHNIDNVYKKLKKRGEGLNVQIMGLNFGQGEERIEKFVDKYKKYGFEVSIHNYSTRTGDTKTVYNNKEVYKNIERKPCHWLFQKIGILWDGKIAPCCYDMEGKVFGNLNIKDFDYDLLKVWNSYEYLKIREEHNNGIFKGSCEKCIDWKYEHPEIENNDNEWIKIY